MQFSLNPLKLFGLMGASGVSDPRSVEASGVRHDCRRNGWGHSCSLDTNSRVFVDGEDPLLTYRCSGHLHPQVKVGDEVIVPFGKGPVVCRFTEVRNCDDPADMYFGTARVMGYLKDLEAQPVTNEVSESAKIKLEGRTRESHPEQWARGNGVQKK